MASKNRLSSNLSSERGTTFLEYTVIALFVAVAAISSLRSLGEGAEKVMICGGGSLTSMSTDGGDPRDGGDGDSGDGEGRGFDVAAACDAILK